MAARKSTVVSLSVIIWAFLQISQALEVDLTVEVSAGAVECFWQGIKPTVSAELEYQVIDGGDLDIDFVVHSPDGHVIQKDRRKTENVVRFEVDVEGDYKFCFDNSFSHMSYKVVFFELIAERDGGNDEEDDEEGDWKEEMEEVKDMVDFPLKELKGILDGAKNNLDKSIQMQTLIKVHEARDRNVAEANFSRVNTFSAFQVFVMVTVGLTQVLMIRSLFQEKSPSRPGFKQQT